MTFEENPCCWSLLLLLLMRILNGVYDWFSFLLSYMGVGTHGFEKWGMTWINLCPSRIKPFLQLLPAWQYLVYWRGSVISWAGFFCGLITSGHDSKLKAKLWNLTTSGYKECEAWSSTIYKTSQLCFSSAEPTRFVFIQLWKYLELQVRQSPMPTPLQRSVLAVDV